MASSCLDTDHLQRHLHILHLAASKMDCNFWASIMLPLIFSLPPMKACIPSSLPSAMATKSASAIVMVQSLQPVEFKPLQAKEPERWWLNWLNSIQHYSTISKWEFKFSMSLEETSNHVNSQDVQWTAVIAVILLKFSCWPRRLLHPLSQHHCRSSNQGRTCPPDQRRWWWTGTPWSDWVNLHQVSLDWDLCV